MTVNQLMLDKFKQLDTQSVNIYYYYPNVYKCTVNIDSYFDSDAQYLFGEDEIIKQENHGSELWIYIE